MSDRPARLDGLRAVAPHRAARADPGNSSQAVVSHVVKPGETLLSISQAYGLDRRRPARAEPLESDVLRPGQRLSVRRPDAEAAAADSAQIATMRAPGMKKSAVAERTTQSGAKVTRGSKATPRAHRAQGRDALEIAAQHGVTVSALKRANGLRSNNVRSGQRLCCPPDASAKTLRPALPFGAPADSFAAGAGRCMDSGPSTTPPAGWGAEVLSTTDAPMGALRPITMFSGTRARLPTTTSPLERCSGHARLAASRRRARRGPRRRCALPCPRSRGRARRPDR